MTLRYGDLTSSRDAEDIMNWAWDSLGHLDVVIANAAEILLGDDNAKGGKPPVNNSRNKFHTT